ncbi:MAG: hypothetical protein HFE97_01815 [Oscillospiraceae bacterium]|nr:hypothetical protein [Oscillospiraceae bacterium]
MRSSTPVQWVIRVLIYILGLFFLAFGVAISANSNLGISPVNSLPYVVSAIVSRDPGTCVTAVFCVYILLQIIILRREFKPINLFQIAFSTIFGYFVNFTKTIVGDFAIPTYAGKLAMVGISIVLVAIGVVLYIEVELVPMPMEGLSLAGAGKLKISFHNMKIIIDCLVVLTGAALSLLCLHKLVYIREGTILTAVVTGKVMALVKKPLSPLLQKICFATQAESAGKEGGRGA